MRSLLAWFRGRILPAVVTAAGVALLVAGLLTYEGPPEAVAVTPSAAPSGPATEPPLPSLLPLPTLTPSASPSSSSDPVAARIASRVVVPLLRIDLPVVPPPNEPNHFPYCNVAEYLPDLSQPGLPGTTYLYAHAREGMFLPLLRTADAKMKGMLVEVYTNDNLVFLYEINQVLRNQSGLAVAFEGTAEQLMLQTSEGPRKGLPGYTGLYTIVIARPLGVIPADPQAAHPIAKPVACQ